VRAQTTAHPHIHAHKQKWRRDEGAHRAAAGSEREGGERGNRPSWEKAPQLWRRSTKATATTPSTLRISEDFFLVVTLSTCQPATIEASQPASQPGGAHTCTEEESKQTSNRGRGESHDSKSVANSQKTGRAGPTKVPSKQMQEHKESTLACMRMHMPRRQS
jgi:hypothetical protein